MRYSFQPWLLLQLRYIFLIRPWNQKSMEFQIRLEHIPTFFFASMFGLVNCDRRFFIDGSRIRLHLMYLMSFIGFDTSFAKPKYKKAEKNEKPGKCGFVVFFFFFIFFLSAVFLGVFRLGKSSADTTPPVTVYVAEITAIHSRINKTYHSFVWVPSRCSISGIHCGYPPHTTCALMNAWTIKATSETF